MRLGEMDLEEAAEQAGGNWKTFECFFWCRADDLPDPDNWMVIYTHHRDSDLMDLSNAAAIEAALDTFTSGNNPDVVAESHDHWAVGWMGGVSIRVYRRGRITKAFQRWHELAQRLSAYPVLDEADYSRRQYEATLANLPEAARRLRADYDLPEGWESVVYDWLADHDDRAIENRDDRGGFPSERQLRAAFDALGYGQAALCEI
jgi:hypothetical protein